MNEREEKAKKDEQLKLLENVRNLFNLGLQEQKSLLGPYKDNPQAKEIFNKIDILKSEI